MSVWCASSGPSVVGRPFRAWWVPSCPIPALVVAALLPGAARAQSHPPLLDASATYTLDVAANLRGGLRRDVVGLGNLDVTLYVDGEALDGWAGTTLFLYGLLNHGGEPSDLVGDAQIANNIEAPGAVRLYEAWIEHNLVDAGLSFLAGLYDVNSEFDVIQEARLFVNSSFGIGAEFGNSGRNGPSIFPVTSLGARLQWHPTREWYGQAALLDGVPGDPDDPAATEVDLSGRDGALWVAEVGYASHHAPSGAPAEHGIGRRHVHTFGPWRMAAGVWQYTRRRERVGGAESLTPRPGVYVLVEGRPGRRGAGGPGLFARAGLADGRTERFHAYVGGGLTWRGPLRGREADVAGLGVAAAFQGEDFRELRRRSGVERPARAETALELTYRARATSWLTVQPDLQWIVDPAAGSSASDALLLTLRLVASF